MRKLIGTIGLLLAARREQRLNRQIFRLVWTSECGARYAMDYGLVGVIGFARRSLSGYLGFTKGWTITTQL